jgi:hypothetical protein
MKSVVGDTQHRTNGKVLSSRICKIQGLAPSNDQVEAPTQACCDRALPSNVHIVNIPHLLHADGDSRYPLQSADSTTAWVFCCLHFSTVSSRAQASDASFPPTLQIEDRVGRPRAMVRARC